MALTKITGQVVNDSTGLVVGVTTVGGGLSATDGFFSGIVTAVGDASFSGNVSVGGTLTYEDVTNIDAVGLVTARNGIVVGSGITLSKDGDGFFTGVVTATSYVGDGSALTGLSGVSVANQSDNRLITATGTTDALNGESGLTYSSNILDVTNAVRLPDDGTVHFGVSDTAYVRGKDSTDGYLKLGTAGLERVRIDSSGRAIIGGTTALDTTAGALTIDCGTSGGRIALRGTTTNASSGIGEVFAHWDTTKVAGFQMRSGTDTSNKDDGTIEFYTANGSGVVERLSIAAAGDVTVKTGNLVIGTAGKGIDFSAQTATSTTGASATAEILDHYEEGTWTPILTSGETCSVYAATYTRIGRQVTAYCFIYNFSDFSGNTNGFNIEGLPFSRASTSNYYGGGMIGYVHNMNYGHPIHPLVSDTPSIYFHRQDGTTATWKYVDFHNVGNGSGGMLIMQVVYDTN